MPFCCCGAKKKKDVQEPLTDGSDTSKKPNLQRKKTTPINEAVLGDAPSQLHVSETLDQASRPPLSQQQGSRQGEGPADVKSFPAADPNLGTASAKPSLRKAGETSPRESATMSPNVTEEGDQSLLNGGQHSADDATKHGSEKPKTRIIFIPITLGGVQVLFEEETNVWRAANTKNSPSTGIGFRLSKDMEDKSGGEQLCYGDSICGRDDGDGWLKCEVENDTRMAFLPVGVNGRQVMIEEAPNLWRATAPEIPKARSSFRASISAGSTGSGSAASAGVCFRRSKKLEDRLLTGQLLPYGETVFGFLEDDWIRCQVSRVKAEQDESTAAGRKSTQSRQSTQSGGASPKAAAAPKAMHLLQPIEEGPSFAGRRSWLSSKLSRSGPSRKTSPAAFAETAQSRQAESRIPMTAELEAMPPAQRAAALASMSAEQQAAAIAAMPPEAKAATLAAMSCEQQAAAIASMPPQEKAATLAAMSPEQQAAAIASMPPQAKAATLSAMSPEQQAALLSTMSPETKAASLAAMSHEQQAAALATMSPEAKAALLAAMSPEQQAAALAARSPEDQAATISAMSPEDEAAALGSGALDATSGSRRKNGGARISGTGQVSGGQPMVMVPVEAMVMVPLAKFSDPNASILEARAREELRKKEQGEIRAREDAELEHIYVSEATSELHSAVRLNDFRRVRWLMSGEDGPRVEVDALNKQGLTAAVCAARDGRTEVCVALLDGRADPLMRDRYKCHCGDGVWPDEKRPDKYGTPTAGAGPESEVGRTVVFHMRLTGIFDDVLARVCPAIRTALVRSIADAIQLRWGVPALCAAARSGKPQLVGVLLSNSQAPSAAPAASESGSAAGSNPVSPTRSPHAERGAALLEAVVNKQWATVEVLLAAGITRYQLDHTRHDHGMTVLHMAASAGQEGVAKSLLSARAATNTFNGYGRTPLHEACALGRTGVVKVLLEYDADASALVSDRGGRRTEVGKTPLEVAVLNKHGHLSSYFVESELLEESSIMVGSPDRRGYDSTKRPVAWSEASASKGKGVLLSGIRALP